MSDKIEINIDEVKLLLHYFRPLIADISVGGSTTFGLLQLSGILEKMETAIHPKIIRRPPTDQDAIDQPRRKCWVRGRQTEPWNMAELISVEKNAVRTFVAREPCCIADYYLYCEIEVPNE